MKIVILTGAELRHTFLRMTIALDPKIKVLRSYCEGTETSLSHKFRAPISGSDLRHRHISDREASERSFFQNFVETSGDKSAPVFLPKGDINLPENVDEISALAPDLVVAYGCSLIREPLISSFPKRFLNVHLGLSPYYRGSGTNFWPLVEGRPECVGATFMYLDAGIDTGEIIHQVRATMYPEDTPHQIGNRLIQDISQIYPKVIRAANQLMQMPPLPLPDDVRICRQKDYSENSVEALYRRFDDGMIKKYLANQSERWTSTPILENPAITAFD